MNPGQELRTETWIGAADVSDVGERDVEMDPGIQAVWEGARVAGPAFTVGIPRGDHRGVFRAIETAEPGTVLVIDARGGTDRCVFGAVTATAARERGIVGAVIDGVIRDRDAIREMGFPVFARGWTPRAPRPQAEGSLRGDVVVGGILVQHGDYIVGDGDGVVRIRRDETELALGRARLLVEQERDIVVQLEGGSQLSDFSNQLKRLNEGQLS